LSTPEPLRRAFSSLESRNWRLYVSGQAVSLCGTWMQTVAELWLVLRLTNSGIGLGVATALQFTPMLVLGAWGGLIVDRVQKRRLLVCTQATMALPAIAFVVLVSTGQTRLWIVYALIFARGCVNVVDLPARQSFVAEMVGRKLLPSAVALNSALVNSARVVGPAIAGVLIATVGLVPCFAFNALSFIAVIFALMRMDVSKLHRTAPVPRGRGQLREGLRAVIHTPELRLPLVLLVVVSTLAFNFQTLLPLFAHDTFNGGGATYGAMTAAMGLGAIAGALTVASRAKPTERFLIAMTIAFGALILAVAVAPSFDLALVLLVPLGATSIAYASTTNATLQVTVDPAMRGRVMAIYSVIFLGSTPLGGPLVGWVASADGPRAGLALGGVATLAAGLIAAAAPLRARRRAEAAATVTAG
jgi:MFS family permease